MKFKTFDTIDRFLYDINFLPNDTYKLTKLISVISIKNKMNVNLKLNKIYEI